MVRLHRGVDVPDATLVGLDKTSILDIRSFVSMIVNREFSCVIEKAAWVDFLVIYVEKSSSFCLKVMRRLPSDPRLPRPPSLHPTPPTEEQLPARHTA